MLRWLLGLIAPRLQPLHDALPVDLPDPSDVPDLAARTARTLEEVEASESNLGLLAFHRERLCTAPGSGRNGAHNDGRRQACLLVLLLGRRRVR